MSGYSLRDAARILKVSPKRLRHWERTVLQRLDRRAESGGSGDGSGVAAGRGSGSRGCDEGGEAGGEGSGEASPYGAPAFDFRDLVCARALLGLIEQGIPLRRIRHSVELLRDTVPELDDPVGSLRLWAEGSARVVVEREGCLMEPGGQLVLDFRGQEPGAGEVAALEERRRLEDPEGQAARAHACFERGCELDSETATFADAAAAYREAIEIDPDFADAHCNLGAVLFNQGRTAESRRCFERCLEIDPRHVEANFNLANVLEEQGADELALRHYLVALRGDPLYPDLHVNLALLLEKMGRLARSREHWRRYLQIEPEGPWADVARARIRPSGEG